MVPMDDARRDNGPANAELFTLQAAAYLHQDPADQQLPAV
jgi:hypothetical protein